MAKTKEYADVLTDADVPFTSTAAGLHMQWGMMPTTIIKAQKNL